MVDQASFMQCQACSVLLPTTYFYDHLFSSDSACYQQREEGGETSKMMPQEEFTYDQDASQNNVLMGSAGFNFFRGII
jgi:hypothetical protein